MDSSQPQDDASSRDLPSRELQPSPGTPASPALQNATSFSAAESSPTGVSPRPERSTLEAPALTAVSTLPAEYADRSAGLTVFGIIQILLGLLSLLGIPLVLLTAVMSRKTMGGSVPVGSYVQGMLTYAMIAVLLVTLGVGSIRARRWAWAITLVTSWLWLIIGATMTVMLTAVVPTSFAAGMKAASGGSTPISRGFMAAVLTFMIVLFAVFLIAVPIAFLIFYRRKDVEETCKRRDPQERWTDRCPLPVLAVSLLFACACVYYVVNSFTAPLVPFFGRWLTGWSGGLGYLFLAVLDAILAFSLYRLKIAGWWVAAAAVLLRALSSILTFLKGNLFEAYSKMGMSQAQLQMMSSNPAMRSGFVLWMSLLFTLALLGYLAWIKRYFAPRT